MSTNANDIRFLGRTSLRQFYANSRNNIEDPIFTGFTMEIDRLHSPLFFALAGDEYTASETLRSYDGSDTYLAEKIEEKLAYVNKYSITGSPDTYEVTTLPAKDRFGSSNDRKPGYGLWDKYYMDNVIYGAADYIYMVDKVNDGTYTDDYGVTDIGNGAPMGTMFDGYNDALASDPELDVHADSVKGKIDEMTAKQDMDIFFNLDKYSVSEIKEKSNKDALDNFIIFLKENPDCTVKLDGYASKDNATAEHNMELSKNRVNSIKDYLISNGIDSSRITTDYHGDVVQPFDGIQNRAVTCRVSGDYTQESALQRKISDDSSFPEDYTQEHEANVADMEEAKSTYESKAGSDSEYRKKQDELKGIKASIDEEKDSAKAELDWYQREMGNLESLLKGSLDGDRKNEYRKRIGDVYDRFLKFVRYFGDPSVDSVNVNSKNESFTYSEKYRNIKIDLIVVSDTDDSVFESELKNLADYEKQDEALYRKIWAVTKTRINSTLTNSDATGKIRSLQEDIEKLTKEIYGIHPGGRLGTEADPAPGSICYDYNEKKKTAENDRYMQQDNRLNALKDILSNYDDIQEYERYQSTKNTIERAIPPIDYTMSPEERDNPTLYSERINKARNTRVTYEVPQTVYDMMGFIRGMDDLMHKYPYAMQTVTGLDEAYKKYFDTKDPFMGSGDGKITINCLEYLDIRVSSMFNKYFNAVYDRQYRRERVPINLRRFQCSIFVHDIRNFKESIKSKYTGDSGDLSMITEIALNSLSAIEFKFYDCEIVNDDTGSIFDNVTNVTGGDMRTTNFSFTYGNCIINFLPFEDLRRYVLGKRDIKDFAPDITGDEYNSGHFTEDYIKLNEKSIINGRYSVNDNFNGYDGRYSRENPSGSDMAGNFRRWFDRSELGNVNNNDYREYIRRDSSVAVDDYYKTSIVNDFALGSVAAKNKELTMMDDALRRIVIGISASTGIPVKGVTDALNIGFIDPIINEKDLATPVVKNLGNVSRSIVKDGKVTEYAGTVEGDKDNGKKPDIVKNLGNVNKK